MERGIEKMILRKRSKKRNKRANGNRDRKRNRKRDRKKNRDTKPFEEGKEFFEWVRKKMSLGPKVRLLEQF